MSVLCVFLPNGRFTAAALVYNKQKTKVEKKKYVGYVFKNCFVANKHHDFYKIKIWENILCRHKQTVKMRNKRLQTKINTYASSLQ